MNTVERIGQRLRALSPQALEIEDESAKHVGHIGAQSGGGHYRIVIVSSEFTGKRAIARHRLVYDALAEMMNREIHALAIHALTPDEARTAAA